MRKRIGEVLVAMGAVTEEQVREALAHQRSRRIPLGEALVALGHATDETVARGLARSHGMKFVDLRKGTIAPDVLELVPGEMAAEVRALPLMERGGKLLVAVDDPMKVFALDSLLFVIEQEIEAVMTAPSALTEALTRYYGVGGGDAGARGRAAEAEEDDDEAFEAAEGDDAPIIRLVTQMISDALKQRASDIHVEPFQDRTRIRYRTDGVLAGIAEHPPHLHGPLVSRLKIMAAMDIAEKRKPQDGRIAVQIKGRPIDIRTSVLPSNHGETVVMRLLDKGASLKSLGELGLSSTDYQWFRRVIARPNGIFLVTGPTGSGKTTTLYAALSELNRSDVKIITAEDPVEYNLQGINQVQVRHGIGLDFARILRAMLRQAPNIILVGEIRDRETAEIAIQAALTGHLVFSTLHTNDAASAVTRLIDMGVKPFLVAASLQAVLAQRLVRTLCTECRRPYEPPSSELAALGLTPETLQGASFHRPGGCPTCGGKGYFGRLGIFERLELDSTLREMIFRGESGQKLRQHAIDIGALTTLRQDGLGKVVDGRTTVAEVLRVTATSG